MALARAIDSVLRQTHQNIELVISDNASTDNTETVCRDLAARDARIAYYRQSINCGATGNFKEVLRRARGEYYMWLSDDDWLDTNYVESCLREILKNPNCVMAYGRTRLVSGQNATETPRVLLAQQTASSRVRSYLNQVSYNGQFYGVMRRSVLTKVRYENEYANDWFLVAGMASRGELREAADTFLNKSGGGMSASVEALIEGLGLRRAATQSPWISVGINFFKDVAYRNPAYEHLGRISRLWLGVRAADIIWNTQHPMPAWLRPYIASRLAIARLYWWLRFRVPQLADRYRVG